MYDRPVFYRVHLFETVVVSPTGMREPGVIINPFEYLMTPFHQPVNIKSKVRTHPLQILFCRAAAFYRDFLALAICFLDSLMILSLIILQPSLRVTSEIHWDVSCFRLLALFLCSSSCLIVFFIFSIFLGLAASLTWVFSTNQLLCYCSYLRCPLGQLPTSVNSVIFPSSVTEFRCRSLKMALFMTYHSSSTTCRRLMFP